ncbi:MAG: hypothetical protein BROFUL_02882 [Candidatus Brocadia fulgida]|uniref:Uncharacterized protein n=1 Tax=Candidatus Brocadia fulgida TaxID=380242 RepID=A0A0M2UTW0_9BACT|nr:MAG: hypothetical protein BROFUL_02882 [Candidatus Brocadia fulgida]
MRVLWKNSWELLRQEGALDTGFILWRCKDLPGSRGAASIMSEVWKDEAGETGMGGAKEASCDKQTAQYCLCVKVEGNPKSELYEMVIDNLLSEVYL